MAGLKSYLNFGTTKSKYQSDDSEDDRETKSSIAPESNADKGKGKEAPTPGATEGQGKGKGKATDVENSQDDYESHLDEMRCMLYIHGGGTCSST